MFHVKKQEIDCIVRDMYWQHYLKVGNLYYIVIEIKDVNTGLVHMQVNKHTFDTLRKNSEIKYIMTTWCFFAWFKIKKEDE